MKDNRDLGSSKNDMNSRIRDHGFTEFTHFQRKGSHLKGPLHGTTTKGTQVTSSLGRTAVRKLLGKLSERGLPGNDLLSVI